MATNVDSRKVILRPEIAHRQCTIIYVMNREISQGVVATRVEAVCKVERYHVDVR